MSCQRCVPHTVWVCGIHCLRCTAVLVAGGTLHCLVRWRPCTWACSVVQGLKGGSHVLKAHKHINACAELLSGPRVGSHFLEACGPHSCSRPPCRWCRRAMWMQRNSRSTGSGERGRVDCEPSTCCWVTQWVSAVPLGGWSHLLPGPDPDLAQLRHPPVMRRTAARHSCRLFVYLY